jgi:ATP-dependent Lon protease
MSDADNPIPVNSVVPPVTPVTPVQDAPKAGGLALPDQMLPPNLFVLPINGPIPFPTLLAPMMVSVPRHTAMIEEAISRQRVIALLMTRSSEPTEETKPEDLYDVGVVVKIVKRLRMPDGSVNVLLHGMKRFRSKRYLSEQPYLVVETEYLEDIVEKSTEMDALTRSVVSHVKRLSEGNPFFTDEMRLAMINAPGPGMVADLVAFALSLPKPDAQEFLETLSVKTRFERLLVHLRREQDVADLQKKINDDVNTKLTKLQREFFLKEQLRTIKRELGMEEDGKEKSSRTFRERIEAAGMSEDVKKIALEELSKFETVNEQSPEYNISRNYLETLVSLPWSKESVDNLDLDHAQEVLDAEHFGLTKVKERILEFLAVRKLRAGQGEAIKGSIICLVGPPGVGKTSIGKSIAKTLGRSFFRFSLGGMRDEAEIKGHRRTYVGAMPGKLIQGMKRAGTHNPVLMLDEIDKLGNSYQGDPASALLEVLDPEQNSAFLDHYLDIPYDLSKVLFVMTANSTATIPAALLDRMEVIEIPGYTIEEKEHIAVQYVIPRELEKHGLKPAQLRIERAALRRMMNDYAREPGLRSLQQLIGRLSRKTAARIVKSEKTGRGTAKKSPPIVITELNLVEWLGPQRFHNEMAERISAPGVVTGLAWTSMGGDILFIEAADFPGTGNLKLTGQMGEVMTESAAIAWSYVKRKLAAEEKYDRRYFRSHDFHLHIPAGAIPKDGPSAGVTMATALYSLLSGRKARQRVAMTGELSLIGKVLAVGGIQEKILAARRAGITTVILPRHNEKDMPEVPEYAKKGMTFHFVSSVEEVFQLALIEEGTPKRTHEERVIRKGKREPLQQSSSRQKGKRDKRNVPGKRPMA